MGDPDETIDESVQGIVTNDAVAGETVSGGFGEGNWGPSGGAPREGEPEYAPNDLEDEEIDLDDEP